jgi:hypothetical protein
MGTPGLGEVPAIARGPGAVAAATGGEHEEIAAAEQSFAARVGR